MENYEEKNNFIKERIHDWIKWDDSCREKVIKLLSQWETRDEGFADKLNGVVEIQANHIDLSKMSESDKFYCAHSSGEFNVFKNEVDKWT